MAVLKLGFFNDGFQAVVFGLNRLKAGKHSIER